MLTQEYLLSESSFLFSLQKGVKLPIKRRNLSENTLKIFRTNPHSHVRIDALC